MTDEHQASINRLREELWAMIMAQMEDLRKQIDRLRKDLQELRARNERLESYDRRR